VRTNIHSESCGTFNRRFDDCGCFSWDKKGTHKRVFQKNSLEGATLHFFQNTHLKVLRTLFITMMIICTLGQSPTEPKDDLDYWMRRAEPVAESQPATQPAAARSSPLHADSPLRRADALPGVIELSNGLQLAGWMCGTRDKPWMVWVAEEKRWRRIPPAAVLSITAIVDQEEMKLRWRWKAMGEPEKVYTGESYPFRRLRWRFRLADGSEIIGAVKGQPLWIGAGNQTHGPFLLQERSKGKDGQSLAELVYVRRIVVSARMMRAVQKAQTEPL
jgi:hypothetical protein